MGEKRDNVATVVLLGTLDTKGVEYAFLKTRVEEQGVNALLVDIGVLGDPTIDPDISRGEVATASGTTIESIVGSGDRGLAMTKMTEGAAAILRELHGAGRLDGVVALGGTNGTTVASDAMRALPIGVPKLLVSTVASGDTSPYVAEADITMMHSVVDIAGINRLSELILVNAAGAITGMANAASVYSSDRDDAPVVGASMFGVTTPSVTVARELLESRGYEVLVFHATGTGGRAMEKLIEDGVITATLDVTTTELADELVGGVLSAGPHRLEAAASMGVPQVVSLGALDMVNFGPMDSVPAAFRDRRLHVHNATVTLMRTTEEECAELGRTLAAKLNAAGPLTSVFIPLRGISLISVEGQPFHDPAADEALVRELRAGLADHVRVVELDTHINDPDFAREMVEELDRLYRLRPEGEE